MSLHYYKNLGQMFLRYIYSKLQQKFQNLNLKKGYERGKVLMCGDALGDMEAAQKNGVFYYPILVKKERESWQEFMDVGFEKLLSGEYAGEYQAAKRKQFLKNLGE